MKIAVVLGLVATLAASAEVAVKRLDGSTISGAQIDATVTRLMSAAEVTGAGIAILNDGKVAYMKAYGFRDKEKQLPLTEDSILAGASFTKAAFSYMVMQLVESRAIDLDKPVQEYLPKPLPDYPAYQDLAGDPRYKKITARMLLSHTSGFPNLRWLNSDRKLNINFEPGSRYAYSGEGMELLQLAVETITGKPLRDLMQDRVFRPLGMSRTSMVTDQRFENDFANRYDEYGRPLGHQQHNTAEAAGSLDTTLRDFTALVQAVTEGKLLDKSTRETMLSPQIEIHSRHQFPSLAAPTTDRNDAIRLSYGLGWGLYWNPFGEVFFKEGHDDGVRNYAAVFDQPKDGIVIMTNSSNGEGIFEELLDTLLRDTFTPIEWEGFTPYDKLPARSPLPVHKEIKLDPKLLGKFVGSYELSPGLVLVVTRKEDHLLLQEGAEPPGELFPEGELQFFSKNTDDVIAFDLDGQGKVTRLVVHTGGQTIPIKRID